MMTVNRMVYKKLDRKPEDPMTMPAIKSPVSAKSPVSTVLILLPFLCLLLFSACEDEPPTDYDPQPFVEAYLFVDQPVRDIVVAISQPLTEPFVYSNGFLDDADVTVSTGDTDLELQYRFADGVGSYFYPDTTYKIEAETTYRLHVRLKSGDVITAETMTPQRISWIVKPLEELQYPQDTVNLPSDDSLYISWTRGNNSEFLIRVTNLDTLGYGKYLNPPTGEINGRTNNLARFETAERATFYSRTRWGYLQFNVVPTVWTAFRWYGWNEVSILAPDKAFIDWFKSTQWTGRTVELNSTYSNVEGGYGVFGSASIISSDTFLLKRQQ